MKILVLMGQRKEKYEGEYAPEALAVMTEADDSDNPYYLVEEKEKHDRSGEFEKTAVITLEASTPEIMQILRPTAKAIHAIVVD